MLEQVVQQVVENVPALAVFVIFAIYVMKHMAQKDKMFVESLGRQIDSAEKLQNESISALRENSSALSGLKEAIHGIGKNMP